MTRVHEIDPLHDERWPEFLERHQLASVFHTPGWLGALQRTYGYKVGAVTTAAHGERLTNALVFCRIQSWLTGRRLVSVPFSDHCSPLVEGQEEFARLLAPLKNEWDHGDEKYLEIRSAVGGNGVESGMADAATFCLHRLDLRPSLSELFHAFHGNCIRRKIARANREGVTYEEGTSEELLSQFYKLAVMTRQRQGVPPQPLSWFRNLIACVGDRVKIRLASYAGQPAAAILTIRYKSTMTYKYGCSDPQFHRLGSAQLLMWKAIQEAKGDGLLEFDMGRTEWSNHGLLTYKDRWGSARSTLKYLRYPTPRQRSQETIPMRIAKVIVGWTPSRLVTTAGGILYRHIG